jgi:integrase
MHRDALKLFLALKSPHTARAYRTVIRQFALVCPKAEKTTPMHIVKYFNTLEGRSQNTRMHRYNLLKVWFDYLTVMEIVSRNPLAGLRRAISLRRGGEVRPTVFIPAPAVLSALKLPPETEQGISDRCALALLAGSGLRRSELLSLNVGDLMVTPAGTFFLKLKKTKAGRLQERAIPSWAWEHVSALLLQRKHQGAAEDDPLLINVRGYGGEHQRICVETLYRRVKKYLSAVGVHTGCHSFRATFASRLLEQGYSDRDVARALGHSSTKMIAVYDKRAHGVDESCAKKISYAVKKK